ncbi:hypothetical protein [Bacillus sp. X1(2014)]|uniref:hypothetical protein n=1 Tax=Bacillus sp. X1(2014) TaxID=1565991 RepID=UPI0011A3008B|nr:hypothetical protein [Bacillus sp. X1(2014)]
MKVNDEIYQIEGYLNLIKDRSIFELYEVKQIHSYPIIETIEHYENIINSSSIGRPIKPGDYTFKMNLRNGDFYDINWDIQKVKRVIRKKRVKSKQINIKPLLNYIDSSGIDISALSSAFQNTEPIIIGQMAPDLLPPRGEVILDGNHRVYSRHQKGINNVSAFIVPFEEHIKAVTGDIYKNLVKINFNLILIMKYMTGFIPNIPRSCRSINEHT